MDIVPIAPENLRSVWTDVKSGLEAMPASEWIAEDVYHAIKTGESALMLAIGDEGFSGFMVLRRQQTEFTKQTILHVWLAYNKGSADVIEAGLAALRNVAEKTGAQKITFASPRLGWSKRYPLAEATYEIPL